MNINDESKDLIEDIGIYNYGTYIVYRLLFYIKYSCALQKVLIPLIKRSILKHISNYTYLFII